MENQNQIAKSHIELSHLGLVLVVAVMLVGISWMKNPGLFNVFNSKLSSSSAVRDLPSYYAYKMPEELNQPLVAGASTENQGPMIINEDGTLSPALEDGDVLGAFISPEELDINSVQVNTVPDSEQGIVDYLSQSSNVETSQIDGLAFESALNSGDQALIDRESGKLYAIKQGLMNLSVPEGLAQLHKLKILQYEAAANILQNFTQADSNPELVGQYLSRFLKAQQDLDSENSLVKEKYNLDLNAIGSESNEE